VSFNVHAGSYQLTNVHAGLAKLVSAGFNAREIEQVADKLDLPVTLDGNGLGCHGASPWHLCKSRSP
jgi:hypothetical protein